MNGKKKLNVYLRLSTLIGIVLLFACTNKQAESTDQSDPDSKTNFVLL